MIEIPGYLIVSGFVLVLGLGSAGAGIKHNNSRINKVEKKVDEDSSLLHEINGKVDIIIRTLNGKKKDDKS